MAAARPLVRSHAGGGGGTHEPTALVLILDNSPSSGAVVDGRPLLARLKSVARASIARAGSGDRLWLILADGVARAGSREALLATVDSVEPGWRRLDLTTAVARATRLVDAEPLPGREVEVVSDLQRTAFGEGRADIPRGVRVLALAPPGQVVANRGVAQARVTDGAVAITLAGTPGGGPAPVTVRLRATASPVGRSRDVGRALASTGSSASVPLPSMAPGWWIGEAVLDPDEHRLSDPPAGRHARQRYRSARPRRGKRPSHVATPPHGTRRRSQAHRHRRRAATGSARQGDRNRTVCDARLRDAPVRHHLARRREREHPNTARYVRPPLPEGCALQIAHHLHLAPGEGLRVHQPGRPRHRRGEVEAPPAGLYAVHGREQ